MFNYSCVDVQVNMEDVYHQRDYYSPRKTNMCFVSTLFSLNMIINWNNVAFLFVFLLCHIIWWNLRAILKFFAAFNELSLKYLTRECFFKRYLSVLIVPILLTHENLIKDDVILFEAFSTSLFSLHVIVGPFPFLPLRGFHSLNIWWCN